MISIHSCPAYIYLSQAPPPPSNERVDPANIAKPPFRRLEDPGRRAIRGILGRRQLDIEQRGLPRRGVVPGPVVHVLGLRRAVVVPRRALPVDEPR